MSGLRLFKLKTVMLVMLAPYVLLAVGSGFMHNHDGEDGNWPLARHASAIGSVHPVGNDCLLAASLVAAGHHQECAACIWGHSSTSSLQLAHAFAPVDTTVNFTATECRPHCAEPPLLASSRAPPLS
ncbi:MAG: hypothetical protein M1133_07070 [Armatimonadetes bacterium]|nr:hypothetical protein [Armatimonadota bacterium]